jgi:SAM-dependent methyltransferase
MNNVNENLMNRQKKINKGSLLLTMDKIASIRDRYIKRSPQYYQNLVNFFKFNIPAHSKVLEIGCGTGFILNSVNPEYGVGIDISGEMIRIAKQNYPNLIFHQQDAETVQFEEKFDYIIISDTLGYLEDIQKVFSNLKTVCTPSTRIIISYHNFLWEPLLRLLQILHLKMPHKRLNWLNRNDVVNLLNIEGFDVVKTGRRYLMPLYFPLISWFFNKYLAHLPLLNSLCLTGFIIARYPEPTTTTDNFTVSVVIPARNEAGNIEEAVKRIPEMGKHTEIIFVEGGSTDNTQEEILRVCNEWANTKDIKYYRQTGKGKGDAVRLGFEKAEGDILMILDADLTVPPEDLPKFFNAIANGKGEYINGTRLVYPMEDEAMRTLNLLGNKFFSVMFSWILGQRIKDTLCGTKVISAANYQKLKNNRSYFGNFDPFGDFDLIFGSAKLNLKLVEVPIRYRARNYGETNISRFSHGWLLLKMMFYAMHKIKFRS